MATYECSKCGMSVNATCAKCNTQLVNDTLKLDDMLMINISDALEEIFPCKN